MTLHDKRDTLVEYLKLKTEEADWHGVADAAMDLRELEIEIRLTPAVEANPVWRINLDPAVPWTNTKVD